MIREVSGNLLAAPAEALVNTVNTVGVMGKGIALQFRRAYPEMFAEYARDAKAGRLALGRMSVWRTDAMTGPKYVVNFPTKGHWKSKSRLTDIEAGLADLVRVVRDLGIKSIAIPPVGCGNGGLDWAVVEPRIAAAFRELPDVEVMLFAPGAPLKAADMRPASKRPAMTQGRAALVQLLCRYEEAALASSLIEVQKLLYFLQEAGEPLRLDFAKAKYGPYADNLRHVLNAVEGHLLTGFGDGTASVFEAERIKVLPGAVEEASDFLASQPETKDRIERVLHLVEGFESMYGLELLASVHWIATKEESRAASDLEIAVRLVQDWTERKGQLFEAGHIAAAWGALHDRGWLAA